MYDIDLLIRRTQVSLQLVGLLVYVAPKKRKQDEAQQVDRSEQPEPAKIARLASATPSYANGIVAATTSPYAT